MMSYYVQWLPNGYYLILDRVSGLQSLYCEDGTWHCGGLRLSIEAVLQLINI